MTDHLTPERLAELLDNYDHGTDDALEGLLELIAIGSSDWQTKPRSRDNWIRSLKAYQADHVAMLAEIDRLAAEKRDALDECGALQAETLQALAAHNGLTRRLRDAETERDRLWMLLEIERGLTGTARLHADALKRVTVFQIEANWESAGRIQVDELANQLLRALGPQLPRAAPQPDAEPLQDAPVMDFPSEPSPEPQGPAEGFNPFAPLVLDPGKLAAFDGWIANYWQRREAAEAAAPLVSECGHAPQLLVIDEGGVLGCMVCGPSTRPQDSPTATQSAEPAPGDADAPQGPQEPAEALRTLNEWCAHYQVRVIDPDGWRYAQIPCDRPITLDQFHRCAQSSTIDALNPAWQRIAADLAQGDTKDGQLLAIGLAPCRDPQCPVCVGTTKRTDNESEQQ